MASNGSERWAGRARIRLSRAATHLRQLAQRSIAEYFEDRCAQLAASISYYALFAVFPLAILLVAAFGLVIGDEAARSRVVDLVLENVPLREGSGRRDIEQALQDVTGSAGAFGVVGVLGLIFSASGVMAAIRNGLNRAWDLEDRRPPLQGKLIDVLLVLGIGLAAAASLVITLLERLVPSLGDIAGPAASILPVLLSFSVFAFLYRFVPVTEVRFRDLWPGALVAALGYEAAKIGFSLYLQGFSNYSAVYGSIAAVIVFLVFLFIASNVFLLGAEIASEWPRVRAGRYDEQEAREDEQTLGEQIRQLVRRLVLGDPEPEEEERRG